MLWLAPKKQTKSFVSEHLGVRSFLFTDKPESPGVGQQKETEGIVMKCPTVSIVTDCLCENARLRQESRLATLFPGAHISLCGVEHPAAIAFNVVDAVDAVLGSPNPEAAGIVIANGAPRNGEQNNGARFGFTRIVEDGREVLIVATVDGNALSLLEKISGSFDVQTFEPATIVDALGLSNRLQRAQFRSYEIAPAAAWLLAQGQNFTSTPAASIPRLPPQVVWIDNFGNAKTSEFPRGHPGISAGDTVRVRIGDSDRVIEPRCVATLDDLAVNELGLVIGSSGLGDTPTRLFEIMIKKGSAAEELGLQVGTPITLLAKQASTKGGQ